MNRSNVCVAGCALSSALLIAALLLVGVDYPAGVAEVPAPSTQSSAAPSRLVVQRGHSADINAVAVSPTTGSSGLMDGREVCLWRIATGEKLRYLGISSSSSLTIVRTVFGARLGG